MFKRTKGVGKTVLHSKLHKYYSWPHQQIKNLRWHPGKIYGGSGPQPMKSQGGNLHLRDKTRLDLPLSVLAQTFYLQAPFWGKDTLLSHFWSSCSIPVTPFWEHFQQDQHTMMLGTRPHHTWDRHHLLEFAIRHSTRKDEFLCNPEWGGTAQITSESQTWGNVLCLEWNRHHWERGEGGSPGLAYPPQFISICLTVLPSPANIYGINNPASS